MSKLTERLKRLAPGTVVWPSHVKPLYIEAIRMRRIVALVAIIALIGIFI